MSDTHRFRGWPFQQPSDVPVAPLPQAGPRGWACGECLFGVDRANGGLECRRYPPQLFSSVGLPAQPFVGQYHWCGEFQPRDEEKKEV